MILLAYRYVFGMRVCTSCPDCNHTEHGQPCQDVFGSNAVATGGGFGRADAGYTSIEAQKSTGSLHAHSQLFVQCLHQHTPLQEVFRVIEESADDICREYANYAAAIAKATYPETENVDQRLWNKESTWPEQKTNLNIISRPSYQGKSDRCCSPEEWQRLYKRDIQELQELKQHHVHIWNEETEQKEPLTACKRKDKPDECKSGFPRSLLHKTVVLCQGWIQELELVLTGRKSALGSLYGPVNHEYLNATHPVLLTALRCNSDVQIPYRFPLSAKTHDKECMYDCCSGASDITIIEAAQVAQDAQAGYACDYCSKRQPMAFHEVKECCKGHAELNSKIKKEHVNYVGRRHCMRLLSDAYGKGIVRGIVENTNLRANSKDNDVTAAESFRTCFTVDFYGSEYVKLVERMCEKKEFDRSAVFTEINRRTRKLTFRSAADLYGFRPAGTPVWLLSPYEFAMYWKTVQVHIAYTLEEEEESHAILTDKGKLKLASSGTDALVPDEDYVLKTDMPGVLLYPDVAEMRNLRNQWVIVRRNRPVAPRFAGSPLPSRGADNKNRNAMLLTTYFKPWTMMQDQNDADVPHVSDLKTPGLTWHESVQDWFDQKVVNEEAQRYIRNFMSVFRVRPVPEEDGGVNSDDVGSDEELILGEVELEAALKTRIGGKETSKEDWHPESHFGTSLEGMELAGKVWPRTAGVATCCADNPSCNDTSAAMKAARASRCKERSLQARLEEAEKRDTLEIKNLAGAQKVKQWYESLNTRTRGNGQPLVNKEQYEFIGVVVKRVMKELDGETSGENDYGEPLRWGLHGGPGTGKSYVMNLIREELFEEVLQWKPGVQFQVVALQAVMAQLLNGDTIHHAFGIPAFRKNETHEDDKKQLEAAKRALQWRWIFIDEISMVSAKLLAEIDMKLRMIIRDVGTQKCDPFGKRRVFGGLNVIISGDFWQLHPPEGGFLGDVPCEFIQKARKYHPLPTVAHGQSLIWGEKDHGITGITELVVCERTKDVWLQEVQEQVRHGCMSFANHAFMHGLGNGVPGSWAKGEPQCGKKACRDLFVSEESVHECTAEHIMKMECSECSEERMTKEVVASGEQDVRFSQETFWSAPLVFATNDMKYEVNKLRAMQYAQHHKRAVTFAPAKDVISTQALAERPDLVSRKVEWLQRHDRESGDLYGVLPLVQGMPYVLTDHIDRSEQKQLLRGRVGYLHSWEVDAADTSKHVNGQRVLQKNVKVLYLKFYEKCGAEVAWQLDGTTEPGIYPIECKKSAWFLDKGRKNPVLRITRCQVPVAPAFAFTAHAAQGQTYEQGAIVDLRVSNSTSILNGYVGITRVKRRENLLIYRSFPLHLYQKGDQHGPLLLLRHLRGEDIDWKKIEQEYMPSKLCYGCRMSRYKQEFPAHQWNRKNKMPICMQCLQERKRAGTPLDCSVCALWKSLDCFEKKYHTVQSVNFRHCKECIVLHVCKGECGDAKREKEFSPRQWVRRSHADGGVCKECVGIKKGCSGPCKKTKDRAYFSQRQWRYANDQNRLCRTCLINSKKNKKESLRRDITARERNENVADCRKVKVREAERPVAVREAREMEETTKHTETHETHSKRKRLRVSHQNANSASDLLDNQASLGKSKRLKTEEVWCVRCERLIQGYDFSEKQRELPFSRCKNCIKKSLLRFRTAQGFATRQKELEEMKARKGPVKKIALQGFSPEVQSLCKKYEQKGLILDVQSSLEDAGASVRELQELKQEWNKITTRTSEPRSRALQLYAVMIGVLVKLEDDLDDKSNDVVRTHANSSLDVEWTAVEFQRAAQAVCTKRCTTGEAVKVTIEDGKRLLRIFMSRKDTLGSELGTLLRAAKTTHELHTASLEVLAREFEGFLGVGRSQGSSVLGGNSSSSSGSSPRSEKPAEVIAESAEASVYKWVHRGCTAKPANQRFGLGRKPDQKQVYCKACSTKFWTIGKKPEQITKQSASPWVCSGCSQELAKEDFSLKQRTKGAHKKCKSCTT